jgi:hypothetical protein
LSSQRNPIRLPRREKPELDAKVRAALPHHRAFDLELDVTTRQRDRDEQIRTERRHRYATEDQVTATQRQQRRTHAVSTIGRQHAHRGARCDENPIIPDEDAALMPSHAACLADSQRRCRVNSPSIRMI